MKICVLNGSPKGKYSLTLQTVLYLQEKYHDCGFKIINVGQKIKAFERDMREALAAVEEAELILFSYPVYTFTVPYQLHRFIELLKESEADLSGKFAAQITTSKHFFDVTAHCFIKENCLDMGMRYLGGLSADMEDILSQEGRNEASSFWEYMLFCAKNNYCEPFICPEPIPEYTAVLPKTAPIGRFDTVIVTDCSSENTSLAAMICDFRAAYPFKTRIVNISEFAFDGGCLGCLSCAADGKCIYRDGFDAYLRKTIQNADAVVYAFTVKDHSMGSTFKLYDDRQFCNGHRTVSAGRPVGYIIHGNLDTESNLKLIIEGRADVGHNFLAGCATNNEGIIRLSKKLAYALENKLVLPQSFYGVGGTKIFRDLIYLMRGFMKADHKFYKAHDIYDFPQKRRGTALKMKLVGGLMSNPKLKAKIRTKMNEGMIAPYKKAIKKG